MRLGVFGKVGLAFGVLLFAFAGNATFTLLSVRRARQGVVANEAYLELQGSVDAAWKSLNDFAPSLGRSGARLDPNLPLALRTARKDVDDALGTIDRYLEKEPGSLRRADFESWQRQIAALGRQLDLLTGELGAAAVAVFAASEELGRSVIGVRYAFDSVVTPMMSEAFFVRDRERLRYNLALMTRWVASASAPIAVTLFALSMRLIMSSRFFAPRITSSVDV